MGYFKTVSRKKKKQRRFLKIIILIVSVLLLINYIAKKISLDSKYIDYLTYSYLGLDFETKKIKEKEVVPVFKEEIDPIVYLYNTHQTESYKYNKLSSYNIDYSVMFASYILESYLEQYEISAVVETKLVSDVLKAKNLKYQDSYKASRILLEESTQNYPSLRYFIDLHRDSSNYEKTTCEINGEKYAKVMFVIGLEHEKHDLNKAFANTLHEMLIGVNPCLSRGIIEKSGEGVDGIYNQDFNENTILLEIGGQYNQIDEVNNTLKVLANILYEYIMEDE